jgi:hypothetical protein
VNPIFLLGCYGCIFHGTGNLAQLCQNLGMSGGVLTPQTPIRYTTAVLQCDRYCLHTVCRCLMSYRQANRHTKRNTAKSLDTFFCECFWQIQKIKINAYNFFSVAGMIIMITFLTLSTPCEWVELSFCLVIKQPTNASRK